MFTTTCNNICRLSGHIIYFYYIVFSLSKVWYFQRPYSIGIHKDKSSHHLSKKNNISVAKASPCCRYDVLSFYRAEAVHFWGFIFKFPLELPYGLCNLFFILNYFRRLVSRCNFKFLYNLSPSLILSFFLLKVFVVNLVVFHLLYFTVVIVLVFDFFFGYPICDEEFDILD